MARAAERAGRDGAGGPRRADRRRAIAPADAGRAAAEPPPGRSLEVTSVTVLPAEEEPARYLDGEPDGGRRGRASPTGCPGIRDEHDDDGGWQARWLDRPTWDRTVTPNIRRADRQRPVSERRRRR